MAAFASLKGGPVCWVFSPAGGKACRGTAYSTPTFPVCFLKWSRYATAARATTATARELMAATAGAGKGALAAAPAPLELLQLPAAASDRPGPVATKE